MRPSRGSFHPLWNQLNQFQSEMNRLFDRWNGGPAYGAGAPAFPAFNVWEEGDHVVVEAELPGLDLKDLEIYVTGGNQLTLKGQRNEPAVDKGVWHRRERGFGSFARVITLPVDFDPDRVEARFAHGVLTVTMPKSETAKPRKITVKAE